MAADEFSPENVIAVSFDDDSQAYTAMVALKELDAQGQAGLEAAAVVRRGDDGRIDVKDEAGDDSLYGTAGGGLIGLLIGVLGGPLGIMLGGATGLLVGSLFDLDDADDNDSVLGDVAKSIAVGRDAVLARVTEQSPEVIDTAMARLTGTVVRRSVVDVEAEIAAAEEAQRKAKREARKQLREARQEKSHAKAHAKVEELKAKLHRDPKPASTAS